MPAEPGSHPAQPGREAFERAVQLTRVQLDAARGRRRDAEALTASWRGGHRERFDAGLGDIERRYRQLADTLALVALLQRRVADEELMR